MASEEKRLEELGISYGGRGVGGEYYGWDEDVSSLWVRDGSEQTVTPEQLEAIAAHMRFIESQGDAGDGT